MNQLIAAPNPKSPLFLRDVAILELLYASGLRASELCGVMMRDLNSSVGVVRVLGKGSKERIVPVGRMATEAIARYLADCRPKLVRMNDEHLIFVADGSTDGADWFVDAGGEIRAQERDSAGGIATYAPALFCDAFNRRRSGPARGAGTAGAQRHQHDSDLYARGSGSAEGGASEVSSEEIAFITGGVYGHW